MSQAQSRPLVEATPLQVDLPRSVRFDGILEGTVGDQDALELALQRLAQLGAPAFEVSFEGEQCSLLVSDAVLPGAPFTPTYWATLEDHLESVVRGFAPGCEVETTLRCRERFLDREQQSVFVHDAQGLHRVTRVRARRTRAVAGGVAGHDHDDGDGGGDGAGAEGDEDRSGAADDANSSGRQRGSGPARRRSALVILALFLVIAVLVVAHEGLIFRLKPAPSAALIIDPGPFNHLLRLDTTQSWGTYHVTISRGPAFPASTSAAVQGVGATTTLGTHAAMNLVLEGGEIYVLLESASGKTLGMTVVSLRALLESTGGHAQGELPGDIRAARIRCALAAPEGGE